MEDEFRSAFDYAAIGMAIVSPDGKFTRVNQSLCKFVGYNEKELLEKTFQEITHPEDLSKDLEFVRQMLNSEIDTYQMEKRYFHKKGHIVPVVLSVSLVKNEAGKPIHFISQIQDVTEQKKALAAAEAATHAKTQFLANMSHEIRTPLTSILGFTESILANELNVNERNGALEAVLRNGKHLLGIVNDILDLSKVESGKLEFKQIDTTLYEILSDIDLMVRPKAEEKGIEFKYEYKFPLPRKIKTDPMRLKQILINLAGNAIKFTKAGGVTMVVSCDRQSEQITFDVVDTGIGFTPEQGKKLFQAFSQGDTSTTREFGGTGLGLVISFELARRLGGGISVQSELGKGSVFSSTIATGPLVDSQMETSQLTPAAVQANIPVDGYLKRGRKAKILITEDGHDNQLLVSVILKKAEYDYSIACNGAIALEMVEKEEFDIILMDMHMPVMDGYTATQKLRERGCLIPIVALTANVMKSDIQKCLDVGCTDFLGKPIDRKRFLEKLRHYIENPTSIAVASQIVTEIS